MDAWNALETAGGEIVEVFLQHGMFRLHWPSSTEVILEHESRLDDACLEITISLRARTESLNAAAVHPAVADRVAELTARLKFGSLSNAELHCLSAVVLAIQPVDFWADRTSPCRSAGRPRVAEKSLYALHAYLPRFDNGSDLWNAIREAAERVM